MNIGIDIDGVLTDIHGFNLRYAPGFFRKHYSCDVADADAYDIRDMYCCSDEQFRAYWNKYLLRYALFEPTRKGAKETICNLRKDGHSIFIISKRVLTTRKDFLGKLMREIVRNWLWRNGIKHNEVIFCNNDIPDSKRTACLEKRIDVMVDDEAVNIEAIAPIAKVICFDTSYKRECEGENIVRALNWNEIADIINGMVNDV